jgi:hypothetical protein
LLQKPAIFLRGMIYRNVTWGALRSIVITSIACFSARVHIFCVGIERREEFLHCIKRNGFYSSNFLSLIYDS